MSKRSVIIPQRVLIYLFTFLGGQQTRFSFEGAEVTRPLRNSQSHSLGNLAHQKAERNSEKDWMNLLCITLKWADQICCC